MERAPLSAAFNFARGQHLENMNKKRVSLICFWFGALFCGLWIYVFPSNAPPKERKMLEKFFEHRAVYENLREKLIEDSAIRAVYAYGGVITTKSGVVRMPSDVNFSVSRYDEYLVLLKQVESSEVFRAGENDSRICIAIWAGGFAGDTRHVDICWLERAPDNQIADFDNFYKTPKPRHPVFCHVQGDWYLWADR